MDHYTEEYHAVIRTLVTPFAKRLFAELDKFALGRSTAHLEVNRKGYYTDQSAINADVSRCLFDTYPGIYTKRNEVAQ